MGFQDGAITKPSYIENPPKPKLTVKERTNAMKVATLSNAKGLLFYCEGCQQNHYADERWTFNGDMEKPTFHPSILVRFDNKLHDGKEITNFVCHSFVRDGKIEYLTDCSHQLAGQTVELKDEDDWYEELPEERQDNGRMEGN